MKLTTPMQITAADSDARTITGRIVAFNEHANASTGKVVFARGSIQPNDVFLNLEHDNYAQNWAQRCHVCERQRNDSDISYRQHHRRFTDALTEAMDRLARRILN
jgi:hypothetical protein